MFNCSPRNLVLRTGTKLATVSSVNVTTDCQPFVVPSEGSPTTKYHGDSVTISLKQLNEFAKDYGFDINPELTSDQRHQLLSLLYKYRACFARNLYELRRYPNYELEVQLKDKRPFYQRQFKLSEQDCLECHKQIRQMVECDIVTPSQNSNYKSAMFTVRKSNGQKRVILDLRLANSRLEPFLVKIPRKSEILNALAAEKATYYSSLDLTNAFYK
jgi:hypothetical protein